MRMLWALLVGCSSSDAVLPEWLPPPANAVSQCRYDKVPAEPYVATTIMHFDDRGRPIQYDGLATTDDSELVRASTIFTYDEQGRLARMTENDREIRWIYSDSTVSESDSRWGTAWFEIDAQGRVVHQHGGRGEMQYMYEDDRIGRRWSTVDDRLFMYDERGRLTGSRNASDGLQPATVTYVESGNRVTVDVTSMRVMNLGFTLIYDDESRLSELWTDGVGTIVYTYTPGVIEHRIMNTNGVTIYTGTGTCPLPKALLAAPPRRIEPPAYLFETRYLFSDVGDLN
jgi:YD repeat-containing protein